MRGSAAMCIASGMLFKAFECVQHGPKQKFNKGGQHPPDCPLGPGRHSILLGVPG